MILFPEKLAKISRVGAVIIGLLLVGYICYLVFAQYRSGLALQESAVRQLVFDMERRAQSLSYFFSEREEDLRQLADGRELSAYFENKALGMSMDYGLRASLVAVQELIDRARRDDHLGDQDIFLRIVFVDAAGRKLIDSRQDGVPGQEKEWSSFRSSSRNPIISFERTGNDSLFLVSVPTFFKQKYVGQVVGWISADTVYHYFVKGENPAANKVCLLFGKEFLHHPPPEEVLTHPELIDIRPGKPHLFDVAGTEGEKGEGFAVLVRVQNTPLSLLTFQLPSQQFPLTSPRRVLLVTGGLAVFILVGMFFSLRTNMRNVLLSAHLEEATVREREVAEKNRQLAGEIRERYLAEDSLQRERDFVETLFETAQVIMLVLDSQGRVLRFNQYMRELSGYDLEEVRGRDWLYYFVPAEAREEQRRFFQEILEGKPSRPMVSAIVTRGGEEREIEWHNKPLYDARKRLVGTLCVGRDITERKKLEAEIIKAEKLESLGILAGGIAHDFNNLLTAVLGNISVATTLADSCGELRQRLSDSEQACKKAIGLTRQLLTFAKGGSPIRKSASIPEIIKESVGLALSGSNVRPDIRIADAVWPVEIDAGQIGQVLHNLCINAMQAMPGGGVVKVLCENVTVAPEEGVSLPERRYVKITVSDQGTGIAKEHLGKIFDPYFTTKEKGSGLGLASCFSIIQNHQGHIAVESEKGEGACFQIHLPASDRPLVLKAEEPAPVIHRGGRILVMEDEDLVRKVIGIMLNKLGYVPAFTEDGEAAIAEYVAAQAAGRPYDAVIMDLTVPGGMGGVEAVQRLLEIDPDITAVVSSGYSNDPVMANFADYGFKGVVTKPYTLDELDELLAKVIIREAPELLPPPAVG